MSELVEKKEDLIRYFEQGGKPRAQWRVGSEYEKVVVRTSDGTAIPYSGAGGVEELLRRMAADYGFGPRDRHRDHVRVNGGRAAIPLDPGGQVELPGEQCESLGCASDEFSRHVQHLIEVTRHIGATVLGP